ncbi:MAG: hypothetical protein CMP69_01070 [Flavobacteriales bacterium]|nr:hypothetical protein [Flavobacteriales bacterium]
MNDELNLKDLFTRLILFISRNFKLIFGIIFIGVISVILYQKFKTPYYETKAICMSGISEYERVEYEEDWLQRTAIDLVNHLEINVENRDYQALSRSLGIDIKTASNIKKIEAEQLYQKDMHEEFFTLNKFNILLKVYDKNVIADVQEGLIYYFNNNNYVNELYQRFKKSKQRVIEDINNEMKLLQEIRLKGIVDNTNFSSSLKVVNGYEKSTINNQITILSEYREKIRTQKEILKPLSFVQEFARVSKKEDDILIWSLIGGVISFLLAMFISRVREIKK